MTTATISQLPVRIPRHIAPPLIHGACLVCTPMDRTFCGIDATAMMLRHANGENPTCAVCFDLDKSHNWAGHLLGAS